jgi:hypothetical protein
MSERQEWSRMTTADRVSTIIAGLAVLIALVALAQMWRMRRRNPARSEPTAIDDVISVGLVPAADGGRVWRLQAIGGAATTSVDIFSYRRSSPDGRGPWRHELMDDPVVLSPGTPVHLPAPSADGAAYDVSIAWITTRPDGAAKGRRFMTVLSM